MNSEERRTTFREIYKCLKLNGKQIIDEMCSCGHHRSDHLDRYSMGHGACIKMGCVCNQFTWVSWVLE